MTRYLAILMPLLLLSACVVVEEKRSPGIAHRGGPPPWAPAHGHRAKQTRAYYYYPSVGVYYDLSTKMYFFASGGSWQTSLTLPTTLVIAHNEAIRLELETDTPYLYIDDHRRKYKPHTPKDKPKKFKQGKNHARSF